MDWSAFAPNRPPGSSPPPGGSVATPSSPTWSSQSGGRNNFIPGQLVDGFGQMHLATSPQQFASGGANPTSPSQLQPTAYPYASHNGLPPSPSRAASHSGYAASSRPRPPAAAPLASSAGSSGLSPVRPTQHSPFDTASSSKPSPRKASLPPAPTNPLGSSPALPPLPLPPTPAGAQPPQSGSSTFPTSSSYSSLNGAPSASRSSPPRKTSTKRANPLEDLIATETVYVQDLGVVIKRVAAAWSRANFPPPALDSMFRAVEAVYRINKTLLLKLQEIGPNPSSPKALGDLLMRWVDDIEPAYTRYARTFAFNYDLYEPVQSNPNLAPILAELDWPASLPAPSAASNSRVTLDRLFELPLYRVQYYKRLYAKLLRSTQEGRSDHALLVSANEKLAILESLCEEGRRRSVVPPPAEPEPELEPERALLSMPDEAQLEAEEEVVHFTPSGHVPDPPLPVPPIREQQAEPTVEDKGTGGESPVQKRKSPPRLQLDMPVASANGATTLPPPVPVVQSVGRTASDSESSESKRSGVPNRISEDSVAFDSPLSTDSLRSSGATGISTANTSTIQSFSPLPDLDSPLRIDDLERRLNTERTLDIFTMQPRRCKLQIQPPSLPFHRELRLATEAQLSFVPTSDLAQRTVTHSNAHILLLTDLFLICERVAPEDSAVANGADFWLIYPPLAGKHLRAEEIGLDAVEIAVMQKERLTVRFNGPDASSRACDLVAAVRAVVEFGTRQTPPPQARQNSLASAYGHALKSPISSHGHGVDGRPMPPSLPPAPGGPQQQSRPQLQLQPLQPPYGMDPSRRVVSGPGSSVPRPSRGASMQQREASPGGLVQSPSASSFLHHSSSSHGPSPAPSPNDYGGQDASRYSMNSSGSRSPYGPGPRRSSQAASDFGELSQSGSSYYGRSDSRQSNASYSSNRTDSFGRWPEAPPPLPKERTYNGMDISGRGGPLYATNLRGDSLHVPGRMSPGAMHRARSADALRSDALQQQQLQYRSPSQTLIDGGRAASAPNSARSVASSGGGAGRIVPEQSFGDVSPPSSPVKSQAPEKTAIVAQMRCKVFLQQQHAVWKSLGTAKLRLFHSLPSNRKQLVVDSDKKGGKTIISTIVLEDGVERVGKTGVAVELSHEGDRTGIVHMLQLKTEQSAVGLFEQLLLGTDRARR